MFGLVVGFLGCMDTGTASFSDAGSGGVDAQLLLDTPVANEQAIVETLPIWKIAGSEDRVVVDGWSGAQVFVRRDNEWVEEGKPLAENPTSWSRTVAIDRDTLIIGLPSDDTVGYAAGVVLVFVRSGEDWLQQATLRPEASAEQSRFGSAVAVSGDTVVVGTDFLWSSTPRAYVFEREGERWFERAQLYSIDGDSGRLYSFRVAVHRDTVVVLGPTGVADHQGGHADVFVREGGTWRGQATLWPSGVPRFAESMALHDDTIILGYPGDSDGGPGAGAAHVFVRQEGRWREHKKLIATDAARYDGFGCAVAISGHRAVVSASGRSPASGGGRSYLFSRDGGEWTEAARLMPTQSPAGQRFGVGAGIAGRWGVVPSVLYAGEQANMGKLHMFDLAELSGGQP